jgi:acyl-CoA thioesterase
VRIDLFPDGLAFEVLGESDELVELALDVRPSHVNPVGVVHGGAVFSLLDTAAGFLVSRLCGPGETCVSVSNTTNNVAPTRPEDERLIARARVAQRGRTLVHVDTQAETRAGKLVARGLSVFYIRGARP